MNLNNFLKYHIKNYKTMVFIGINPDEYLKPQQICINITAWVNNKDSATNFDFNYNDIIEVIQKNTENCAHIKLQEDLLMCLKKDLLNINLIEAVNIKIEKLEAYQNAESAGIEALFIKNGI